MKTIFLDFGNVVAHFDHQRAVRQLLKYTSLAPGDLTRIFYDGPLEIAYEMGKVSTEDYFRMGSMEAQLSCTLEQFLTCFVDIFERNPDVCDLLPLLARSYRLVLASNTNHAHFTKYSQQFAKDLKYFSFLGASHQAGHRKPHVDFFAYCQKQAEAEPGECLFVDDLAVNVEAANQFGWKGVLYRPGDKLSEKLRSVGIPIDELIP